MKVYTSYLRQNLLRSFPKFPLYYFHCHCGWRRSPAISVSKRCCSPRDISHCSCPWVLTLRGFWVLGSQNRKKESRMVVAKRQRKEKPMKIEQRKVRGPEWGPQVKQTALLASPIYIGQAQGEEKKTYKKRSQNWARGFFSLRVFWVSLPSCLEDVFSLTF